jgi:uncharacterized membrane protein
MEKKDPEFYLKYAFIILILLAVIAVVFLLAFHEMPAGNKEVIILIVGVLVAQVSTKSNYDWGSSASSARNAQRLNDVLNTAIPTNGNMQQTTTQTTVVQKDGEQSVNP